MFLTRSVKAREPRVDATTKVVVFPIEVETTCAPQFVDITEQVSRCVKEAQATHGCVVVFSRHTTAAIKINENEPLLLKDMEAFLERVAPRNGNYQHNDFSIRTANMTEDECPNGHAHCQHLLLGASETVPIVDGEMQFGQWQRIFLIELDRPRHRDALVQVIGV